MRKPGIASKTVCASIQACCNAGMLHSDTPSACTQLNDLDCTLSICLEIPCFLMCFMTFRPKQLHNIHLSCVSQCCKHHPIPSQQHCYVRGAQLMMHAYPCAWSPLAIPDADLAIKLSPVQAIVFVPCSKHPRPLFISASIMILANSEIVMTKTKLCRASDRKVCWYRGWSGSKMRLRMRRASVFVITQLC